MIRLLVGLGNPGPEYASTRHNAGFWFIDEVARSLGTRLVPERGYYGLVARVMRADGPVWLLQPMTFMNLSGKSVAALARFFRIAPAEILVAHDELDLMPGHVRMKFGGGHAGHNGLKDIQAQLGSADYWRLRLGIGHPGVKAEVVNYVLRKPPADEREAIDKCIMQALAAIDLVLAGEMERAMMKVHARPPRPKPVPVPKALVQPAADADEKAAHVPRSETEGGMPQNCSVCSHGQRIELELAIMAGTPLRAVAARFGTSATSLSRHRGHISGALAKVQETHQVARAATVSEALESFHSKTRGILEECQQIARDAAASGDPKLRLGAVKASLDTLAELRAQLSFRAEVEKHRPQSQQGSEGDAVQNLEQVLRGLLAQAKARRAAIVDVQKVIGTARDATEDAD